MKNSTDFPDFFLKGSLFVFIITAYLTFAKLDNIEWFFINKNNLETTNGIITQSEVEYTGLRGGWRFYITYEYYIEGEKYTSTRVHYGYQSESDKTYALFYKEKYPVGKSIFVYYDPEKINKSVLEPEVVWTDLLYMIICFFGLSITLLILYLIAKKKEW